MVVAVALVLVVSLTVERTWALDNGLGLTPPLGWDTWCTLGKCGNDFCYEAEIQSVADAMSTNGLLELGYQHINLDDCWASYRNETGWLQPDPDRFPSGMKALADYVHSKGLKLGLYTDSGLYTCSQGGRSHTIPGSYGHYLQDAQQFASWGVDYVKMDWCDTTINGTQLDPRVIYPEMSMALNSTGRPIWFSLCEWGVDSPWLWASKCGNSWRITGDHHDEWSSTSSIIQALANLTQSTPVYGAPGGWSDLDFVFTGGQGCTNDSTSVCAGQSWVEYRTEFTFWAFASSPIIVATDIRNMTAEKQEILYNKEVIAVHQDPLGIPSRPFWSDSVNGSTQVWARPLADDTLAVLLLNLNDGPANATISFEFSVLPPTISGQQFNSNTTVVVRDLWLHQDLANFQGSFSATVQPHGVEAYQLSILP